MDADHKCSPWSLYGYVQVADVFESAEKLGLKVVRMWAFNDGDGWNALQPRIGQINEHILRSDRAVYNIRALCCIEHIGQSCPALGGGQVCGCCSTGPRVCTGRAWR